MTSSCLSMINDFLASRLDAKALSFVKNTQAEIVAGCADSRFSALVSLASRYIPRLTLSPSVAEVEAAGKLVSGWSPAAWSLLEAVRVSFVLSRTDLLASDFGDKFNGWFTYADEGEACAYYRSLSLLPEPKRFVWRAAEGCRTNMRTVFMAVTCDSPYPSLCFDDVAWNQMVVKAIFTETPLVRIYGLDQRLSSTLAVMVLDYIDERRSAGRSVPVDAWLCLGDHYDDRVEQSLALALNSDQIQQRAAALLALSRAKRTDKLTGLQQQNTDSRLVPIFKKALTGVITQYVFNDIIASLES